MRGVRPKAGRLATALEAELRRLQCWSDPAPTFDPAVDGPFGMRRIAFEQWLQAVLVPALGAIERGERPVPPSSNLCGHAVREFDGRDDRQPLIDLLYEVDALSGGGGPPILQPKLASAAAWLVLAVALLWAVPGVAFARSVASALVGAAPDLAVLEVAVTETTGSLYRRHFHGIGWWEGERARFDSIEPVPKPGQTRGLNPYSDLAMVARGQVAMAAQPELSHLKTSPFDEFAVALYHGVERDEAAAKLAAVGQVEQFSLDRHPGSVGDGAWFLGFVLVYLPGAAVALAIAVRQRRRLA